MSERSLQPLQELLPKSPLCCLQFNPRQTTLLAGGSYNGSVTLFDHRTGAHAAASSGIDAGHTEPVTGLRWTPNRSDMEIITVSTDRQARVPCCSADLLMRGSRVSRRAQGGGESSAKHCTPPPSLCAAAPVARGVVCCWLRRCGAAPVNHCVAASVCICCSDCVVASFVSSFAIVPLPVGTASAYPLLTVRACVCRCAGGTRGASRSRVCVTL